MRDEGGGVVEWLNGGFFGVKVKLRFGQVINDIASWSNQ